MLSKFPKKLSWSAAFYLASSSLFATSLVVNVPGDTNVATGGSITGTTGDLRGVLNYINQNPGSHTVSFSVGASNTITLNAMLPILNLNAANTIAIDGANSGTQVVINGANTYRGFLANQGAITLQNLTIQNVIAPGGAGGSGGGGGGMGAGAGIFINQAAVTVSNVSINSASATGGAGGNKPLTFNSTGGGGGMGGPGGSDVDDGGCGGGGIGGAGASTVTTSGSGGGGGINCGTNHTGTGGQNTVGQPGGGIGGGPAGNSFAGAAGGINGGGGGSSHTQPAGGGGINGSNGTVSIGGAGGFGGGGGAGSSGGGAGGFGGGGAGSGNNGVTGFGGAGGFGGGGGAGGSSAPAIGGAGGFGGGGGGGISSGTGGGLGGIGGGKGGAGTNDGNGGTGGGGAGFGGALFVNQPGTLTIKGSFGTNTNSTNFGHAGTGPFPGVQGWNAGNTGFFCTGSTISLDPDGSTITLSDSIGDDSAASFVGAPSGVTTGSATGAVLVIGNALSSAGTVNLLGAGTYSGGVTLNKGVLSLGNNTSLGTGTLTSTVSGNTLRASNTIAVTNALALTGDLTLDSNGNTFTLNTPISGTGPLIKTGLGTVVLPIANTYGTGTTLNQGTLQVGNNSSLNTGVLTFATNNGNILQSGGAGLNLNNSILLNTDGAVDTNGNTFTLSGNISGAKSLTKLGVGTLILMGTNTYGGATGVSAGTLQIPSLISFPSGSSVNLNGSTSILDLSSVSGTITIGDLSGVSGSVLNVGANSLVFGTNTASTSFSGNIAGAGATSITKNGSGTALLLGSNTYGGGTFLSQGTLGVGANTSLGTGNLTFQTNNGSVLQSETAGLALTNAIVLNTDGAIDSNGNTFSINGNISGAGGVAINGTGAVNFSGTNTYGNGTLINSPSTLIINTPDSLPSAGSVSTNGTLIFNYATSGVYTGTFSGTGTIILQNSGAVTLSSPGTNPFTGTFNVTAGTLSMNSSFPSASTANIASGATLSGTGTLGAIALFGNVSPGNSIGIIQGTNIAFHAGSNYILEVSDTASDLIIATGGVTIDPGALITVSPLNLGTPLNSYTIITSGSPIVGSGNFTLINPFPRFNFSLDYSATSVFLMITNFNPFTASGNAAGVANAFNDLIAANPDSADLNAVVSVLNLQTQSQLQNSFNQMQPSCLDGLVFAQENVSERIRQNFTAHMLQQRLLFCPDQDPWRLWIAPFLEHVHQRGKQGVSGYKENFAGLTAGMDYQFQHHWIISTGFSFADSNVGTDCKSHGEFKSYAGSLGALWTNDHFYIDGLFSYLFDQVHGKRKMHFSASGTSSINRKAKHHQDSNQVLGHLGTGWDFIWRAGEQGEVHLYPFVNVDYIFLMQEGYVETGAGSLDLKVYAKDYDFLRPEGGLGLAYTGCFQGLKVNVDLTASYVREQRFLGKKTKSRFEEGPKKFTVRGLNPRNNLFSPDLRITLASPSTPNFSFTFGYHGEFGSRFIENAGDAEIRYAF